MKRRICISETGGNIRQTASIWRRRENVITIASIALAARRRFMAYGQQSTLMAPRSIRNLALMAAINKTQTCNKSKLRKHEALRTRCVIGGVAKNVWLERNVGENNGE